MKESISMTTIFQIVVLFILLFTAIMALTINNSNAFGIKDSIITAIEANDGNYIDTEGVFAESNHLNEEITNRLQEAAYRSKGICNKNDTGWEAFDRSGSPVKDDGSASICIKTIEASKGVDKKLLEVFNGKVSEDTFLDGKYYRVKVFYQLDIPVVKQLVNFESKGETKIIYN